MIVYDDVLKKLLEHGWSTYRLSKEHVIGSSTLTRIRAGGPISTETLDTICRLCDCQPGDIIHYEPDEERAE